MVQLDTLSKFTITVAPAIDSGAPGFIDVPPTYPVDKTGVVTLIPSSDGLSCEVRGLAVGSCTITPSAVANGTTITGVPIEITVTAPPEQAATQLLETIGPVVPQ